MVPPSSSEGKGGIRDSLADTVAKSRLSQDGDDKPVGLIGEGVHLAGVAGLSAAHAAIQEPLAGITQLVNHGTKAAGLGSVLPEVHLIDPPKPAEFGSKDWVAQTVGAGAGMVLPFLLTDGAIGAVAKNTRVSGYLSILEKIPLASTVAPLARPVVAGATYSFLFTPVDEKGNFLAQRGVNAAVGGLTFGAQHGATMLVNRGLSALGVPLAEAAFKNSLSGAATRIGANMLGGSFAGVVNAEAGSLLTKGQWATGQDIIKSVATFTVTGGALDLAHIAAGRVFSPGSAGISLDGRQGGLQAGSLREATATGSPDRLPGSSSPKGSQTAPESPGSGQGLSKDVLPGGSKSLLVDKAAPADTVGGANPGHGNSAEVIAAGERLSVAVEQRLSRQVQADAPFAEATAGKQKQEIARLAQDVAAREHTGVEPGEVSRTFEAVSRLLKAEKLLVDLTSEQRLGLAKQLLFEAANPLHADQGPNNTCGATVVQEMLLGRHPGKAAEAVVSLLTTGKYRSFGQPPVEVDLSPATLWELPEPYQNALRPDFEARRSLSRPAGDMLPKVDGERTYVSQLLQLLAVNMHTQGLPEGQTLYVKGRPDPALAGDTGERLFRRGSDGAFEPVMESGVLKTSPGLKSLDLQAVFDRLSGSDSSKGGFVLVNSGQPLAANQGVAFQSARQLEQLISQGKGPFVLEVDPEHPLFGGGNQMAAPFGQTLKRHMVIVDVLRDPVSGEPVRDKASGSALVQISDSFGRDFDRIGAKAVPAAELFAATRQKADVAGAGEVGAVRSLSQNLSEMDAARPAIISELNRTDSRQSNVYKVIQEQLHDSGLESKGWEVYPTAIKSPADAVGADYLLVNKKTGEFHLLDATSNPDKMPPAIRAAGVIQFEPRWFDILGALRVEEFPEAQDFPGRLRQQLEGLTRTSSPFKLGECPFPDFRRLTPDEAKVQVDTFVSWLKEKARQGDPGSRDDLSGYAASLEKGASRFLEVSQVERRDPIFEVKAKEAARAAVLDYIIGRLTRVDPAASGGKPPETVSQVYVRRDKLDASNDRLKLTTADGEHIDGGNISQIFEAARSDLLRLGSISPERAQKAYDQATSDRARQQARIDLDRARSEAKVLKRLEKLGIKPEKVQEALIRLQGEIRNGGKLGSGEAVITRKLVQSLSARGDHVLLGKEPPATKAAPEAKALPKADSLVSMFQDTGDVLQELGMKPTSKAEVIAALQLTLADRGSKWTAGEQSEFRQLIAAYTAGESFAAARVERLLGQSK